MTAIYLKKILSSQLRTCLLVCLLTPVTSWSQSYQSYCFNRSVNLNEAERFVKNILTPSDKVRKNTALNCLEILIDSERVELVEKYLSSRYQTHTNFQQIQSSCDMEITEISVVNKQTDTVKIGRSNNIKRSNENNNNKTVSSIKTMTGKWSSIEMYDSSVDIKCDKRGVSYDIEVRIGSANGFLSTSRNVRVGETLDLGAIIKDINEKNKSVSIDQGLVNSKTNGQDRKTYQLTIR